MNPPAPDEPRTLEQPEETGRQPVPSLLQTPQSSYNLFFGPEGLRAAWGVLIFVVLWLAITLGLSFVVTVLLHTPPMVGSMVTPGSDYAYEGATALGAALATWVMALIEHRRIWDYGFARISMARNLFIGLVTGVALLSLLVFLMRASGLLVFDTRLLTTSAAFRYALIWAGGFALTAIAEELVSRGYLQFTLTRGLAAFYRWIFGARYANALGFWTAAFALSFTFGLAHGSNPGESPLGLASAGLAGLLFCFSLWRTGSLWWAIGFHTTWDWAQSFLYGVPDSGLLVRGRLFATHPVGSVWLAGGTTGPEGSILFLPAMLVGLVAIVLTLPRTNKGYVPATLSERGPAGPDRTAVLP